MTKKEEKIRELLKNAVHFGHRKNKWNPKMAPYLYGDQKGIHIFDLEKTLECLEKALDFLKKEAAEGKIILLVSTKPQAIKLIKEIAQKTKMPYVTQKWIAGLLTNFSTLKKRLKYFLDLKEQEKKGEFEKYTKKEALNLRQTLVKLETAFGGISNLTRLPDAVFVADAVRDNLTVREAVKLKIPVVAILDSNANPAPITYPIPGNDDAIKSLTYLITKIGEAIEEGQKSVKKK